MTVCHSLHVCLMQRIGGKPPPTFDIHSIQDSVANDWILHPSHKFCAILANRAAYCIELDSHKGFAA